MLLTQEEEHSQLFHQLSVEFMVLSIHNVHFIHPYMNPLPDLAQILTYFFVDLVQYLFAYSPNFIFSMVV